MARTGWDHPRSCGEHLTHHGVRANRRGSSPLVRGAHRGHRRRAGFAGIIPARAGSTCPLPGPSRSAGDHPRSCGEHCGPMIVRVPSAGSSPLVRGAPARMHALGGPCGIIPARAGSTPTSPQRSQTSRDHPRSCGEHKACRQCMVPKKGSSPLVRGALDGKDLPRIDDGIIPARAGSTKGLSRHDNAGKDHPRSCGEHCCVRSRPLQSPGSSPLVRGAQFECHRTARVRRIIPARAGSTSNAVLTSTGKRDHPRSCGEHGNRRLMLSRTRGSSPLVRGAPVWGWADTDAIGIIPARAGSTARVRDESHALRDHPRSCGEHPHAVAAMLNA